AASSLSRPTIVRAGPIVLATPPPRSTRRSYDPLRAALKAASQDEPRNGAVAFAATVPAQRDCWHENSPVSIYSCSTLCLRRLPVPTRADRPRGPLVSALRPLVSRHRGTSHRAGYRGWPRPRLSVGAALHAAAGRRRPALPPRRRRPLASRRDLHQ